MADKFTTDLAEYKRNLVKRGASAGPAYGDNPLVWHDQVFERDITPAGSVDCQEALRAGASQNGLDIILVACAANEDPLSIAAGATITVKLAQSDSPDGDFEDVGPTVCVKAPADGIDVEPGGLVARFATGSFSKPWIRPSLEFAGSITGGNVDCALSYVPR